MICPSGLAKRGAEPVKLAAFLLFHTCSYDVILTVCDSGISYYLISVLIGAFKYFFRSPDLSIWEQPCLSKIIQPERRCRTRGSGLLEVILAFFGSSMCFFQGLNNSKYVIKYDQIYSMIHIQYVYSNMSK